MAPKGGNAKKEGGRAKKAENEEKKAVAAEKAKEAKEAEDWKAGSKGASKADVAAAKAAEQAKKKAERDAMLAAEEAAGPSKAKSAPKAGAKKKAPASAGPAISAGGGIANFSIDDPLNLRSGRDESTPIDELSATGIEGMLEALEVANQKTDKQAMGAKAGEIERHPERRFKAAFEAYKEDQMPVIKDEYPGLRKNQYEQKLFERFQKAPENPFNQTQIAYNASKEEKLEKLREVIDAREAKYKVKP